MWIQRENIDPATTSVGDVWFVPDNGTVELGTNYHDEIHVNTGSSKLGAYNFAIAFDTSVIEVDTSQGANGVEKGSDGFFAAVNTSTPGQITVDGVDSIGTGPGADLHVLTINWTAVAVGTSNLTINVVTLTDEDPTGGGASTIGTPNGIDGSRTVDNAVADNSEGNYDDLPSTVFDGLGSISFNKRNGYYVPGVLQSYVYEYGAVILAQGDQSLMVSDPVLVNVQKLDSENIHVSVQIIRLMGFNDELISTGSVSVSTNKINVVESSGSFTGLTIQIKSDYPSAWRSYLEEEYDRLVADGIDAAVNLSQLILVINGIEGASSSGNDVTYTKRYHEVRVTIS